MSDSVLQRNNTLAYARQRDANDPLNAMRSRFFIPKQDGRDVVYFTGNSLGLQPKTTTEAIQQELADWATYGVEGHFLAKNPWLSYHHDESAHSEPTPADGFILPAR